ncbi:putative bin3-type S-adenosyl-L-methionine binding domain-containing protein [Lupinus albus]|uniref:RNA methyltransferase n=1 Tax=Lupinus albus TaxID=3870 RepID=A0A6A4NFC1_LUPAL|nr:putative bin3-type S-adenosyl-L-methionine binding domain-containing protein [Lupinus albus]
MEESQNRNKRKHSIRDPRLMKVIEDPRLNLFKKEWFESKNCLDIGLCNNGTLTIYIAQEFCCKTILGIDYDSDRIKDAIVNRRKSFQSNLALVQTPVKASKLKDGVGASSNRNIPMEHSTLQLRNDLFDKVLFKQENFYREYHTLKEPYDTIIW